MKQLEGIYERLPTINCKRLCQECCSMIPILPVEMDHIKANHGDIFTGAKKMPLGIESGHMITSQAFVVNKFTCPALSKNGECSIHRNRPIICRLWGMVHKMRCPHGCIPSKWLSDKEAFELMREIESLQSQT